MNKQTLIDVLQKVKPGLASKALIENTDAIIFSKSKINTYNDSVAVTAPLKSGISGAIKAELLYSFLSKLKEDEIEMEIKDTELILSCGKAKAGFKLESEISLPLPKIKDEWSPLPEGFIDAVKLCLFSVSKDMTRPIMTCIHSFGNVVESSDNQRITQVLLSKEAKKLIKKSILIPADSASELVKYPVTKFSQTDSWIHFKTEDELIFSCRTYEDSYPDTSELMLVEGEILTLSNKMKEVIERAAVFAKREFKLDEQVKIVLSNKSMLVKSESEDGWFEEDVKVKRTEKNEIKFGVNPGFLAEAIDKMRDCVLGDGMIKFEGENIQHVIQLM